MQSQKIIIIKNKLSELSGDGWYEHPRTYDTHMNRFHSKPRVECALRFIKSVDVISKKLKFREI